MSRMNMGYGRGRGWNTISGLREQGSTARQCQPAGGAARLTCGATFPLKCLTVVLYGSSATSNGAPPCILIHAAGLVRHMPEREKGGWGERERSHLLVAVMDVKSLAAKRDLW